MLALSLTLHFIAIILAGFAVYYSLQHRKAWHAFVADREAGNLTQQQLDARREALWPIARRPARFGLYAALTMLSSLAIQWLFV